MRKLSFSATFLLVVMMYRLYIKGLNVNRFMEQLTQLKDESVVELLR